MTTTPPPGTPPTTAATTSTARPAPVDLSTPHGLRAAERLRTEEVVWLTTVDPSGTPQPTPVWFLWQPGDDGVGEVLLLSRPGTAKLRNVRRSPRVALHFGTDEVGDDVVVLVGRAAVDDGGLTAHQAAAFDARYAGPIRRLGMTPDQFRAEYAVLLRVVPDRLRGW
ncbi:TIGR03667 family PPOX class F420-dependent oxidoreductase [Isoptericola sp. NPDC057653]|uniref:TIGR03667 family PPOX class F420-dependent oxidoreductase n=1 Tax=unclassified Isoptericola TaxID=2623355 RepID=UPI00367FD487